MLRFFAEIVAVCREIRSEEEAVLVSFFTVFLEIGRYRVVFYSKNKCNLYRNFKQIYLYLKIVERFAKYSSIKY